MGASASEASAACDAATAARAAAAAVTAILSGSDAAKPVSPGGIGGTANGRVTSPTEKTMAKPRLSAEGPSIRVCGGRQLRWRSHARSRTCSRLRMGPTYSGLFADSRAQA